MINFILPVHFIWKRANTVTKTLKFLLELSHVAELPMGARLFYCLEYCDWSRV